MSDEEFFMDEEELAEEAKEPKEVETKKKKDKSKRRGVLPETMNFTLAIGLIVCAFAVGFLLRGFFASTTQSPVTEFPPGHPSVRPGVEAPPLTEQQLKGKLPSSHPSIEVTGEAQETIEATSETTAP